MYKPSLTVRLLPPEKIACFFSAFFCKLAQIKLPKLFREIEQRGGTKVLRIAKHGANLNYQEKTSSLPARQLTSQALTKKDTKHLPKDCETVLHDLFFIFVYRKLNRQEASSTWI